MKNPSSRTPPKLPRAKHRENTCLVLCYFRVLLLTAISFSNRRRVRNGYGKDPICFLRVTFPDLFLIYFSYKTFLSNLDYIRQTTDNLLHTGKHGFGSSKLMLMK